jgi:predicted O-methyltransferase YrrM
VPDPPAETVTTLYQRWHVHHSYPHLATLHLWARQPGVRTIVELGVDCGHSTAALLDAGRDNGAEVWSVDNNNDVPGKVPALYHDLGNWHLLLADSHSQTCQDWLPQEIDLLYIDSNHTYDHCSGELKLYGPRVREGGVILGHDTDTQCVADAFTDWCHENGLTWRDTPGPGNWHGMAVIEV